MREHFLLLCAFILGISTTLGGWYLASGFIPWSLAWWHHLGKHIWHARALPVGFMESLWTGLGVILAGLMVVAYMRRGAQSSVMSGNINKKDLKGSARWGRVSDIKRAKLNDKTGVVLGQVSGRILRNNGPQHVALVGPPRSGKGVSVIIPTIQNWEGSTVQLDVKPELHDLTSGDKAAQGHRILKFEPNSLPVSTCYNPLAEIRLDTPYAISDAQGIAIMIMDPEGKGVNHFFDKAGYEWMTIIILHTMCRIRADEDRVANLRDVLLSLSSKGQDLATDEHLQLQILDDMASYDHDDEHINDEVHRVAEENRGLAPETRTSIIKTAMINLTLYADPIIAANTAESDFMIRDIITSDVPVHLYIKIPQKDMPRLKPLIRLFFNQMLGKLATGMEVKDGRATSTAKHRMLLLLDEFTSLGKIPSIENAMPVIPGYGVKMFIIVQDIMQLKEHYGRDNQILANCDFRAFFTPNELETAQMISKLLGKTTVQQKNTSASGKAGELSSSRSTSISYTDRDLMTPDEVMTTVDVLDGDKPGEVLVFARGARPFRAKQWLFFKDKKSRQKTMLPSVWHQTVRDQEEDMNTDYANADRFKEALTRVYSTHNEGERP